MRRTILISAFFCCSLVLSSSLLRGQVTFSVSYDTVNFIQPPNANLNSSVTYDIDVLNTSGNDFFGQVFFVRRVDNGPADTIFIQGASDSIPAFGSRSFQIPDSVTSNRFGGGINVVVVWPTAPNVTTTDTAFGTLNVIGLGIPEGTTDAYPLTVFPNPAAEALYFSAGFPTGMTRQTTLIDQQGRILRCEKGLPKEIRMAGLAAGVYFLVVELRDGSMRRYKVVKGN